MQFKAILKTNRDIVFPTHTKRLIGGSLLWRMMPISYLNEQWWETVQIESQQSIIESNQLTEVLCATYNGGDLENMVRQGDVLVLGDGISEYGRMEITEITSKHLSIGMTEYVNRWNQPKSKASLNCEEDETTELTVEEPRFYAGLRVMAEDLDPLIVTQRLKLPAARTHRRGEPRLKRISTGEVKVASNYSAGYWGMSSKTWVIGYKPQAHIEWILEQIEPLAEEFKQLLIEEKAWADIFCFSSSSYAQPPHIDEQLMNRALKLGLVIDIDHYHDED